jgi:SAM-dependent methyltransferase
VLSLAGGGGWDAILFAELGAETTLFDLSARQLRTVRELAKDRGTKLRFVLGDMRDLSKLAAGGFDLVSHHHSLVFVPDPARVIREVARVLAPGGLYVFSTMHPVTLRMYETWTGSGWGFKQRYFEDGPVQVKNATWDFDDVQVEAPTLEYGHRISDLINACVAAGLVIDGFWETTPGEISTKVPLRPLTREQLIAERDDLEPGSDDALERYLPAFIEWRARKLSPTSASGSATSTAARSRKPSGSRPGRSPTSPRRSPSR